MCPTFFNLALANEHGHECMHSYWKDTSLKLIKDIKMQPVFVPEECSPCLFPHLARGFATSNSPPLHSLTCFHPSASSFCTLYIDLANSIFSLFFFNRMPLPRLAHTNHARLHNTILITTFLETFCLIILLQLIMHACFSVFSVDTTESSSTSTLCLNNY